MQAILLLESFKLVFRLLVPRPFDESPRPKKLQIEVKPTWHLFWRENQLVSTKNSSAKRRALDLENQESG
jgi:hypothetical protein